MYLYSAQNITDTRLLWQPTISKNRIAFIYAEDFWVANLDGSYPRRITVSEGSESNPVFSPDGNMIAFTGQYDGNTDVFIVPARAACQKGLPGIRVQTWSAIFLPMAKKCFLHLSETVLPTVILNSLQLI